MRLWTVHPKYLDSRGLCGLWREALLAQAVLHDRTRGYKHHPQLRRFREHPDPKGAIGSYLEGLHAESLERGYAFDHSRILGHSGAVRLEETTGRLLWEWEHLKAKLRMRAPDVHDSLAAVPTPDPHPMFDIVPGPVKPWEIAASDGQATGRARGAGRCTAGGVPRTGSAGTNQRCLPASFMAMLAGLARSYLSETDPMRASGFGGGAERWRAEREPILAAVIGPGSLLDVGCANGYLLECLFRWGAERGVELTPHGVDVSPGLVELARARLPRFAGNMHVGNAWTWVPPLRYDYVYSLHDCVPAAYLPEYVDRLFDLAVADGGRLILGAYGSRTRGDGPFDVRAFLRDRGYDVAGWSEGGSPAVSLFAWAERRSGMS